MAYFLKQTKVYGRVYLQISETVYNKKTKKSSNRCYKKIGYLDDLASDKMPDPVAHYKEEAKKRNARRNKELEEMKVQKIGEDPTRNFGYFIVKSLYNTLELEKELRVLQRKETDSNVKPQ